MEANRFRLSILFVGLGLFTLIKPRLARKTLDDYRRAEDVRSKRNIDKLHE